MGIWGFSAFTFKVEFASITTNSISKAKYTHCLYDIIHLKGQSTLRLLHTMVLHEGDLMERKRITKGELAILRLVAGQTVLKLATEKIYEHLIDHVCKCGRICLTHPALS